MASDTYFCNQKGSPLDQETFKYAEAVASDFGSDNVNEEGMVGCINVKKKKNL